MKPTLHIKTKAKQEDGEAGPVSPTGQYFNSKALSVCILAILESEVPIDDSCLMTQLQDVFLPINTRFSSIMVTDTKGVRQWKRVEVNLNDHIIVQSLPEGLSAEAYDEHFDEYLTKISVDQLPQDRPLWEFHILKYPTSKAAGHGIFKLHHALGDGYSLVAALLSCVQRADDPSLPLTFPTIRRAEVMSNNRMDVVSWGAKTLSAIYKGAFDFGWSFLKSAYIADDVTPIRSGNKNLGSHPMKISTVDLSLDQIKLIKTKVGATINEVLAGIIFLGIRLYMQATDPESSKSQTTALVLFNTRNIKSYISLEEMDKAHTKLWGNYFAFLHVAMPELMNDKPPNPLDFVNEARKRIERLRNSPTAYLIAHCLEIIRKCRGPEAAAELIYSTLNKASLGISNMIGPIEQVSIADNLVKGIYFMVCGTPKNLAVTIMSYMRTLRIGIGVEKGFIDSRKLNSCIENAFELMYEAAMKS